MGLAEIKWSVNFPIGEDEEHNNESEAILKTIGAKEDEGSGSDCNMWLFILVVYLSLKFSVYFGEEFILNIRLSFTLNKLTGTKSNAIAHDRLWK